jgi:putative ABC transport system permease protein
VNLYESLRTAMTGLTTNKLRAALTMLGIIIGVASVVALLSIGQGVEATISDQIQGIGSNLLFITADQPQDATSPAYLTSEDAEALAGGSPTAPTPRT